MRLVPAPAGGGVTHTKTHQGTRRARSTTAPHLGGRIGRREPLPGAARPTGMRATDLLLVGAVLAVGALTSGCGEETAPAESGSGVAGVVRLGPQCPVEVEGQLCPDVPPVGIKVLISEQLPGELYGAGDLVAETTTDAKGRFRVAVPPGAYVVTAEAGMSCEYMDAVVTAGAFADIDVPCDTGIR